MTITETKLGCLKTNFYFLRVLAAKKSKMEVLACLVSGEAFVPDLQTATSSLPPFKREIKGPFWDF